MVSALHSILLLEADLQVSCDLVVRCFRGVFALPVSFFSSHDANRLGTEVDSTCHVHSFVAKEVLVVTIDIVAVLVTVLLLNSCGVRLALVLVYMVPICVLLCILSEGEFGQCGGTVVRSGTQFRRAGVRGLASTETVVCFGTTSSTVSHVEGRCGTTTSTLCGKNLFDSFVSSSASYVDEVAALIVLITKSILVVSSCLSVNRLTSFFAVSSLFATPVKVLVRDAGRVARTQVSTREVFSVVSVGGSAPSRRRNRVGFSHAKTVHVRSIYFSFPKQEVLLSRFGTRVLPKRVGLVHNDGNYKGDALTTVLVHKCEPSDKIVSIKSASVTHVPLGR